MQPDKGMYPQPHIPNSCTKPAALHLHILAHASVSILIVPNFPYAMSLDLSSLGESSSYSGSVSPEDRECMHSPSAEPFALRIMWRVTSCSQDVLKISLLNNWWYTKPPAKRQQVPAAPSHCQKRSTRSCKSNRLPSNRTMSSPTNSSHLNFCRSFISGTTQPQVPLSTELSETSSSHSFFPITNYHKLSKQRLS